MKVNFIKILKFLGMYDLEKVIKEKHKEIDILMDKVRVSFLTIYQYAKDTNRPESYMDMIKDFQDYLTEMELRVLFEFKQKRFINEDLFNEEYQRLISDIKNIDIRYKQLWHNMLD